MFRMKRKLDELVNRGEEIRVALVGAGKMGTGLVNQISRIKGMSTSIIIDEKLDKACHALKSAGIKDDDIVNTTSLKQAELALSKNKFVISDDYTLAYKLGKIQGVVDATGNPPFGA